MTELVEHLNLENIDDLKKRLRGLYFSGNKSLKKQELIDLVEKFLQIEKLKNYWEKLGCIEQKAIAEVIYNTNGSFDDSQFFAKYQSHPKFSQKTEGRYSYSPADSHNWNILQERYILCFLFEFAATLGLIDVAYVSPHQARKDYGDMWGTDDLSFLSRYDGLVYFRVNNLGKFCLDLEQQYVALKPTANTIDILVSEDGEITINSPDVSSDIIVVLEQFCKRQNSENNKKSNSWLLDKESLLTSLELGYELSQLSALFLQYNVSLPQNIEVLIKDIESKCNQIKIKDRVILFECVLPDLAKQLAGDSQVNRYCSIVGERLLAVPEEKLIKFQAAIKSLGYVVRN